MRHAQLWALRRHSDKTNQNPAQRASVFTRQCAGARQEETQGQVCPGGLEMSSGLTERRKWRVNRARSKKLLRGRGRPLLGSVFSLQRTCGLWEGTDCRAGGHRRTGTGWCGNGVREDRAQVGRWAGG